MRTFVYCPVIKPDIYSEVLVTYKALKIPFQTVKFSLGDPPSVLLGTFPKSSGLGAISFFAEFLVILSYASIVISNLSVRILYAGSTPSSFAV